MRRTLFRFADAMELGMTYLLCFLLGLLFDYVNSMELDSYILKAFFENFMDYQKLIVFLFTSIVMVFHYQMFLRKKIEIYCRMLVGDTRSSIAIRYILDCLLILGFIYFVSILINIYMCFDLAGNLYLVLIFITYILISASQVRKYENF